MTKLIQVFLCCVLLVMALHSTVMLAIEKNNNKKDEEKVPENSWLLLSSQQLKQVDSYVQDYKDYIYAGTTELTFVSETIRRAKRKGFKRLARNSQLKPGARYFDVNRDRTISLIVIGEQPISQGLRIVGAHIDSPRLELKGRPLYEKEKFALFQTYIHGGIKTYQWVNIPLALVGRVDKKDGTKVEISVGLNPDDPVLIVPDLAPHVDVPNRERKNREVIKKEELDVIIASKPAIDHSVEDQVIALLKSKYDIDIDDLVSAELALVPAMPPRDVGLDRSLLAAYGQDDKASSIAAVKAIMSLEKPQYTAIAFLVDNEEVGNINNTGARSSYLVDLMSDLLFKEMGNENYNDYHLRKVLNKTKVVSADVNPGVHPTWTGVWELGNAPRLGQGVNLKLYGGGFNANSEYMAWTRNYLDNAKVKWQTSTYKGKASGGTIGTSLSKDNMEVVDIGIPILSIHSPYAVSSKVDLFSLYQAMQAFYLQKG